MMLRNLIFFANRQLNSEVAQFAAEESLCRSRERLRRRFWHLASTFFSIYSGLYEPLQYPLLFPHGSPGWGLSDNISGRQRKRS